MTATGMGAAKASISSAAPSRATASIRSCASAAMRGASFSTWRETKARLTRFLSLVCSGGSISRIEWRSSASNGLRCAFGAGQPSSSRLITMQDLAAEALVAQQRRDVGVSRKAPEAVVLPEEDGRSGADRGVGRIGIVDEGGIARVEADAAARGVEGQGHGVDVIRADTPPQRRRDRRPCCRGTNRARSAPR